MMKLTETMEEAEAALVAAEAAVKAWDASAGGKRRELRRLQAALAWAQADVATRKRKSGNAEAAEAAVPDADVKSKGKGKDKDKGLKAE